MCKRKKIDFISTKSLKRLQEFNNKRIIQKNKTGHSDLIVDNFPINDSST